MKYIYYSLIIALSLFIIISCSTESTPIYQLTTNVEPIDAGTVSPASGEYEEGEQVNITATSNEHWVFDSWQGGHSGSTNPATVTMDSDKTITALFIKREYPLTVNTEGEGTVSERVVQAKTTDYPHGTTVELTANAADGWMFTEWSGDVSSTEEVMEVTIDKETNVTATFSPIVFLSQNGTTILCPNGDVRDIGVVNGVEYEVVDRVLLDLRIEEGKGSLIRSVCVSLVSDMNRLFQGLTFNQPIGDWDVSNVTVMDRMFLNSQFNQPIANWDVSKVTTMRRMFRGSKFNQPIGDWDVSNVTNMNLMFSGSIFNQPIGDWDVSNVRIISSMFHSSQFNQPIGNWDVSNVTNMNMMFQRSKFNQPIGDWDVSNVVNMYALFDSSPFNQPIGDWDVSNVLSMVAMFLETSFNQDISGWCVWRLGTEPSKFSYKSSLIEEYKPIWGTCPD